MKTVLANPEIAAVGDTSPGIFEFRGPGGMIRASGQVAPVARGRADTIDQRVSQAFATAGAQTIIAGALPFSRKCEDYLFRADCLAARAPTTVAARQDRPVFQLRAAPSAGGYAGNVAQVVDMMRQEAGLPDGLRKIVLARSLELRTASPIAVDTLLSRLAEDDSVTAFRVALPSVAGSPSDRCLVGATPELLVEKQGSRVRSCPLAGSARRSREMGEDARACAGLAGSDKDRREHAMVVEYILDLLSPYCTRLECPDGTRLTCTRSMWHLGTRITGELRDPDTPSAVLAAILHPTPAVCGLPCQRAADLIEQIEPVARDFYAGAVGWCDASGDGAWYVAIRCAEICGQQARLFAGAGIVEGSDPAAEAAETGSKFAAMLQALGLPADAALTE